MDVMKLLAFHVSPLELMLRGTVMYWFLFAIFRFVLRRDAGALGIADLLFVVIVADASQNAMGGSYDTIAEGCVLVGTLVAWNYLLDWASYRWERVRRFTDPPPVLLISKGRVIARNLRRELVTPDELSSQLRQKGINSIKEVRQAFLESDGNFSVLIYGGNAEHGAAGQKPVA